MPERAVMERMVARILVVEDEPALARVLGDLLIAAGYQPKLASDGRTGLKQALQGQFDLLLLDIDLPGWSALELCRELRRGGSEAPVMLLSGRAELLDRARALKLGVEDSLMKPFEPLELLARIEALLRPENTKACDRL